MSFLPPLWLALLSSGLFSEPLTAAPGAEPAFGSVDVIVDSGSRPLAAYQLEVSASAGAVKIAGIEGGEHPRFREPPFYDPRALQQERVILAAYSTAAAGDLPKGQTRVATIHFQVSGEERPRFGVAVHTAGDPDGTRLVVKAILKERNPE